MYKRDRHETEAGTRKGGGRRLARRLCRRRVTCIRQIKNILQIVIFGILPSYYWWNVELVVVNDEHTSVSSP